MTASITGPQVSFLGVESCAELCCVSAYSLALAYAYMVLCVTQIMELFSNIQSKA